MDSFFVVYSRYIRSSSIYMQGHEPASAPGVQGEVIVDYNYYGNGGDKHCNMRIGRAN
jgi:hypothetical protein